jgi:AbrB family looped-hinge helix DNA binding protein
MDKEEWVQINENGRVVVPAAFRKALGINPGDKLAVRLEEDGLKITTMKQRIARAQRRARKYIKPGTSLVDEFLAERREAAKRE